MLEMKYEQPKFEIVAFASTDILMTSTAAGETTVVRGGLSESYDGAKGSIVWDDVWSE